VERSLVVGFLAWACAAAPSVAGPAAPASAGGPAALGRPGAALAAARTTTLPNGLTVVALRDPSRPVVAVQMLYRVGARDETIGITGIAHFVEHMLFRGTKSFGLKDVTGVIERAGGEWHGYTFLDCTTFFEAAPRDLLPVLLRLEAERMTAARLAPAEVDPERGAVFEEYRGYQNDPRSELFDATIAALFLEHPYRNNTMGWESDLAGITYDDLAGFYRRYYGPRNAVLAVAGDFEDAALDRLVRETFDPIPPGGESALVRTVEPALTGPRRIVIRRPGAEPALMISFLAPPPARPADYAALLILDAILGHAKGLSFLRHSEETTAGADVDPAGRLGALLPGGPASRLGTSLLPTLYPYAYSLYAGPAPGRGVAEIEPLLFGALRKAAGSITPAEVGAARLRVEAADLLETDALVERTHELAFWTGLGGPGARQAVLDALAGVGADAVRALAATLTRDRAAIGVLLPAGGPDEGEPGPVPAGGPPSAPARTSAAAAPPTPATGGPGPAGSPGARAKAVPKRADRSGVATLDLAPGARAIVDARSGLATFVLRMAVGAVDVARLRAAGVALEADPGARDRLSALGVSLAIEPPGDGSLAEADTLQVILEGPAGALDPAVRALAPALARALASTGTAAEPPSRDPERRARQLLLAAMREPGTTAGPAVSNASPAGTISLALVSPYAPESVRGLLRDLARAATAVGDRGPRPKGGGTSFPAGRRVESIPDIAQGRLLFAFGGGADPEALAALAYVLHHRYSGRLGVKAIAEMGLVYSMQSEVVARDRPFAWVAMGAVPGSLPKLETALGEVLDRTADTLTEEEVAEYRSFAPGDLEVRLTDPEKAAHLYGSALLRGEGDAGPAAAAARARGMTRSRVAALARAVLAPDRRLTIVVTREDSAAR
jgi:predicted Zn-dependent peptidase